jgi:hypothetical protein
MFENENDAVTMYASTSLPTMFTSCHPTTLVRKRPLLFLTCPPFLLPLSFPYAMFLNLKQQLAETLYSDVDSFLLVRASNNYFGLFSASRRQPGSHAVCLGKLGLVPKICNFSFWGCRRHFYFLLSIHFGYELLSVFSLNSSIL